MSSRVLVFTSSKGGVGKTPFAVMASMAMYELGERVVALDMNFLNPDLHQILLRLGGGKSDIISKVGGSPLIPQLLITDIYGDGTLYTAARVKKYMYLPYPPIHLFKSILSVLETLGDDVNIVVDTNLNIASLIGLDLTQINYIDALVKETEKISFAHILTPSSMIREGGFEKISELDYIESVINTYNRYELDFMGRKGEGLIYIFTPTILKTERGGGFFGFLKSALKKSSSGYSTLSIPEDLKGQFNYILEALVEPYVRSTRYLSIDELKEISNRFLESTRIQSQLRGDLVASLNSYEFQNAFLIFVFNNLYDPATRTLPKNSLFVPFFVEKMLNVVDILLSFEELDLETIKSRLDPVYKLVKAWIENVFLR